MGKRERPYKYNPDQAVIIMAADEGYMDHARAAMANCKAEGKWEGSFALIVPKGVDGSEFARRGVTVQESHDADPFYQKYHIFAPYFQRWKVALYMDCDTLVQGDLMPLINEVQENRIIADREEFTLEHCFTYWQREKEAESGRLGEPIPKDQADYLDHLWTTYGKAYRQFNTSCLLFQPADYPLSTHPDLLTMHESLKLVNSHVLRGTDQPVINLSFYQHFTAVRDRMFCYWARATDATKIIHYCSGYAPWIDKTDGMDGFYNSKLGARCYDVYSRNLANFDALFPQVAE